MRKLLKRVREKRHKRKVTFIGSSLPPDPMEKPDLRNLFCLCCLNVLKNIPSPAVSFTMAATVK